MKKFLLLLLKQHYADIIKNWAEKLCFLDKKNISFNQLLIFAENTLKTIIEVIEKSKYEIADQYIIDIYNFFNKENLNLLEVSQVFSQGRYSIIPYIEKVKYQDTLILLSFLDEVIEQIYARFGVLYLETKLNEVEKDKNRLAKKLKRNDQYLKNIMHTSDSAIMVIDENEKIAAWNKGAEKIFGYSEEEVINKSSMLLLPKEERFIKELDEIIENVKKFGHYRVEETERIDKQGNIVNVSLSVTKMPGKEDNSGRTVIIKDVTNVKQLQRQVDQSEKLAVIGQLAAGVAHEIGNPLASISMLVQLLQRKATDSFFKENLYEIKENIDRISKIVKELVDFSRPPGKDNETSQIKDIIKTALGIVKYDKRVKKVNFITDIDKSYPEIQVIPDQLLQVFINILFNALDAIMGEGTISVKLDKDEYFIYTHIIDDGIGMEEKIMKQIFDPFFTTKEVGKGTGLGLSVSYGIVKKFGGDILVKSKTGSGSTFTIKLPIRNRQ